jgi:hypothetical protein
MCAGRSQRLHSDAQLFVRAHAVTQHHNLERADILRLPKQIPATKVTLQCMRVHRLAAATVFSHCRSTPDAPPGTECASSLQ